MGKLRFALAALPFAVAFTSCVANDSEDRPSAGAPAPGAPGGSGPDDTEPTAETSGLPALSGGTLAISADQTLAVVSDPDRERVLVVRLDGGVVHTISLERGDEPGRVVEDGAGQFHVVLRGSSQVLTIDPQSGESRRSTVCVAPRGIAFDPTADQLHVACAPGELWTLAAATGEAVRKLELEPDLRDVVVQGDRLFVSRFRSAEVLLVGANGDILDRRRPSDSFGFRPNVAWRMVPFGAGVAVVHQRSTTREIEIGPSAPPGAYDCGQNGCEGPLQEGGVTVYEEDTTGALALRELGLSSLLLPVDIAGSPTGEQLFVVATGSQALGHVDLSAQTGCTAGCVGLGPSPLLRPVAVAYAGERLVIQGRNPAALHVLNGAETHTIELGGRDVTDAAYELYHFGRANPEISCASCHPEGREDGHVWAFSGLGLRRTQSLVGGIGDSAPFHWSGDMADLGSLMHEVFEKRMDQGPISTGEIAAVGAWLDGLPELPMRPGSEASSPGRAAFEKAGCQDCHAGESLRSNGSHDVGTGAKFQVPSLRGVAARAPYMHDGCAPTLEARFDGTTCGGTKHGNASALSDSEMESLLAYLRSI